MQETIELLKAALWNYSLLAIAINNWDDVFSELKNHTVAAIPWGIVKPQAPKTRWCCPPFYFYTREDSKKLGDAIKDGCGVDAPGSFISWLCQRSPVYAMEMPGSRYDVGNLESYTKIKNEYRGITKC